MIELAGGNPRLLERLDKAIAGAKADKTDVEPLSQARNVSPEKLGDWIEREQLNDPEIIFPNLFRHLEDVIGDSWLFDRSTVGGSSVGQKSPS